MVFDLPAKKRSAAEKIKARRTNCSICVVDNIAVKLAKNK